MEILWAVLSSYNTAEQHGKHWKEQTVSLFCTPLTSLEDTNNRILYLQSFVTGVHLHNSYPHMPLYYISFASLTYLLILPSYLQRHPEWKQWVCLYLKYHRLYCNASGKSKQRKTKNSPSKPKILEDSAFGCAEVLSSIKLFIISHYPPLSKIFAISDGSTIFHWLHFKSCIRYYERP